MDRLKSDDSISTLIINDISSTLKHRLKSRVSCLCIIQNLNEWLFSLTKMNGWLGKSKKSLLVCVLFVTSVIPRVVISPRRSLRTTILRVASRGRPSIKS